VKDQYYRSAGRHYAVRTSIWRPEEKPAKTVDTLFDRDEVEPND
jgi:hypothetical protein